MNYSMEVAYGARWVNLNDHENFVVHAETTPNRAQAYRQVRASSQLVDGDVLLHSSKDMVTENVKVLVYGQSESLLQENIELLELLFEQFRYAIRTTLGDSVTTWSCQSASAITIEHGHVYMHNQMAAVTAQIPRLPKVDRVRVLG